MGALSDEALSQALEGPLSAWRVADNALERVYTGKDYLTALALVSAVGHLAEAEDHHPDMALHYKRLTIRYWTHTAGGITERDVDSARKVEALIARDFDA